MKSRLLTHLEDIKKIMIDAGYKPKKFLYRKNEYAIYEDIVLVKAPIIGNTYITNLDRYGYFLIDKEDLDMIADKSYKIRYYLTSRSKTPSVYVCANSARLFTNLLIHKYPFTDKKYEYYASKNGNPLDLRKKNLVESETRNKSYINKSGIVGVYFIKDRNCWKTSMMCRGMKQKDKYFPIAKYGKEARERAIEMRKKWEKEIKFNIF